MDEKGWNNESTIVAFDMRYSTSYADPVLKMRENLCFRYYKF
jgi:hypothetical protein